MPNDRCEHPLLSATGDFVSFDSRASDLVPRDTNGMVDVFVFDRRTRTMERVSHSGAGGEANGSCFLSDMGPDGRFIVFSSLADNLVPEDTNGVSDVFIHDRATGATTLESIPNTGITTSHALQVSLR